MRKYEAAGVAVPEILLPKSDLSMTKWAVVACDQYTSQPEYWSEVERLVGDAPSTLKMVYPEAYLNEAEPEKRIASIRKAMDTYLKDGVFAGHDGMIYVERLARGRVRKGLVLCIDLENYDYSVGSKSLIRATEGTILDRIPPRVKIREGAPVESPHIMVLIDDPEDTVLGPLTQGKMDFQKVYDFDLMMDSGHLTGYLVSSRAAEEAVMKGLEKLGAPEAFAKRYGLDPSIPVLLYAMGDGNHSLATAKAIWEKTKKAAANVESVMNSPTRYALVELVNLHDTSLDFEPIHRVIFDIAKDKDLLGEIVTALSAKVNEVGSVDEMVAQVRESTSEAQRFGVIHGTKQAVVHVGSPKSNLPVGSLQAVLDSFMKAGGAREIDYVHGTGPVDDLGRKPGNMSFFLPGMDKHDLFKSVILDGALPRKTFSMGEAEEKRFYMECRSLT